MQISGLTRTSFGANLRSKTEILKYNKDNEHYDKVSASFVEINPSDYKDLKSVSNAVSSWEGDLYGMNVVYAMERLSYVWGSDLSDKFYAITTQNKDLDSLDPDKIKAITHVKESQDGVDIIHLQTNPYLIYVIGNPEYMHAGKGIVDGLKKIYNDKPIYVNSAISAIGFYESQGFKKTDDSNNALVWGV